MRKSHVQARIAQDLLNLGVRPGGVLLVHSSLRSLGHVPGGPETVVRGLLDALGPDGTLLMPALSYEFVHERQPVFDVRTTPCCVGAIPEHFRTRPGTLRSVHPTHSVCGVGPEAAELLADHHLDTTPVGANSPFRRLPERGGQILMLGCGLRPNTSMHGVEEVAGAPYAFGGWATFELVHADGKRTKMRCRRHGFVGWRQRYDRIEPLLDGEGLRTGRVLEAGCHLLEASRLWERALETLRGNPFYFVQRRVE